MQRRQALKFITSASALFFATLCKPLHVFAKWNEAAFSAEKLETALKEFFPDQEIIPSKQINIQTHSVAENGAVVPVKIETDLPKPESITIMVEYNPNPLIASFDLGNNSVGIISTRIKMDKSSDIIALVKTPTGVYSNRSFVEVKEGGCG